VLQSEGQVLLGQEVDTVQLSRHPTITACGYLLATVPHVAPVAKHKLPIRAGLEKLFCIEQAETLVYIGYKYLILFQKGTDPILLQTDRGCGTKRQTFRVKDKQKCH